MIIFSFSLVIAFFHLLIYFYAYFNAHTGTKYFNVIGKKVIGEKKY